MRIALMQAEAAPLDPEKNLSAIDAAAAAALDAGAELLLAPELFVTGYVPRSLASWLTPERVAEFPAELSRIAAARGIAVAAGFPAARMDGGFAIAAGLWDRGGAEVLRYEKVHLWGAEERLAFIASDAEPRIAEWNGHRVAFQICYDIEFPEPARALAARGADLLLVPTAIDGESDYVAEVLVRARAGREPPRGGVRRSRALGGCPARRTDRRLRRAEHGGRPGGGRPGPGRARQRSADRGHP
ncbi:hypothetical protein CRE_23801 [Caenorhabditis remanei]|uniref:CN hydrolase domain-containing protein n=1 Tax=Caenorhabditis remanei TaxID=31234 RepID=E3NPP0_CAERE|nr:hypothetical protein CRE_23801 [Caenorhabditis remanei]